MCPVSTDAESVTPISTITRQTRIDRPLLATWPAVLGCNEMLREPDRERRLLLETSGTPEADLPQLRCIRQAGRSGFENWSVCGWHQSRRKRRNGRSKVNVSIGGSTVKEYSPKRGEAVRFHPAASADVMTRPLSDEGSPKTSGDDVFGRYMRGVDPRGLPAVSNRRPSHG